MRATSQQRKAQIITEATRLFGRDGYDRVTIKQLADACGVTEPAIYRHYESKDAIYDAVLDQVKNQLETKDLFTRLENETDVEQLLLQLAEYILEFFVRRQEIHRLILYSTLHDRVRGRQVFDSVRGTFVRFLTVQLDRLYQSGAIIERNNEITARCFIGMVFDCALNATLWKGMLGKVHQPVEVIANNIPIYARGLRQ